eukprot:GEMP01031725.1.p1 GENE.GEMP01031725.1~~GEMP01031725.1.p1  ORF type:complete len:432 (-),score=102.30 GEMP01031725.1:876-2141(-)
MGTFTGDDVKHPNFRDRLDGFGLAEKQNMALHASRLIGGDEFRFFFVPGRIEVMGKHTDYCGGKSLLAAVNRGFMCAWEPSDRMEVLLGEDRFDWDISEDVEKEGWAKYFVTASKRLYDNFQVKPVKIAIISDLPESSGMSSSSALICAAFMALEARNDLKNHPLYQKELAQPERLYEYLGCIENGQTCGTLVGNKGVGTFGGSEDHTAIMSCKDDQLNLFSYCPTVFIRTVEVGRHIIFCVAVSGVLAEKTGAQQDDYNHAVRCSQDVLALGQTEVPGAHTLADLLKAGWEPKLDAGAQLRWEQFKAEDRLVTAFADAIDKSDFAALRPLTVETMEHSDKGLRNIIPETRWLSKKALELGAFGASAFGAGFGGSTWALVPVEKSEEFLMAWEAGYKSEFPQRTRATFFSTHPTRGAMHIA